MCGRFAGSAKLVESGTTSRERRSIRSTAEVTDQSTVGWSHRTGLSAFSVSPDWPVSIFVDQVRGSSPIPGHVLLTPPRRP